MNRVLFAFASLVCLVFTPSISQAYGFRYAPAPRYFAPAPRYYAPPPRIYTPPPRVYTAPRIYTPPPRVYTRPNPAPLPQYHPQPNIGNQPHYSNPQVVPRPVNPQGPRFTATPPRPMQPAVITPHPRGINAGPGRVVGFVNPHMIPRYRPWRWVGGSVVAGAGAYYYFSTVDNVVLMPSGVDNSGPAFDIEAFIRLLLDDGSAPNGDPDAISTDTTDELVPE